MTRPIVELTKEIDNALVERTDSVWGVSAALLARQHVVLLGPPGTAKSKQLLALVRHLKGARIFERLLFETTPTEEVLGPLSLKALKNDQYRRVTTGRIQECHIAFLEEVFNANDPILHALMRLINERLFEDESGVHEVPLESAVAATNLIPTKPGLMAVYDRFLLRFRVPPIQDADGFLKMLEMPDPETLVKQDLTLDELHAAQKEAAALEVTKDVFTGLVQIRAALRSNGIEPSDRRFKQAVGVLKAYAYLGGRDVVGMDDLSATRYMLWTTPEQESKVAQEVLRVASPMLGRVEDIHDDVMRHFAEAQSAAAKDEGKGKKTQIFVEWLGRTKTQMDEVAGLITQMKREGRDPTRAEQLLRAIETKYQGEIQTNLGSLMSKGGKKG